MGRIQENKINRKYLKKMICTKHLNNGIKIICDSKKL